VLGCGRGFQDAALGVVVGVGKDRRSVVQGVNRCGSVWADPVCSAKIRAFRSEEFGQLIARHIRAGGRAFFVTLTARHYARHRLEDLFDAITETWKLLISGRNWVGDRQALGIIGNIRSTEVTFGLLRFGWHPHLHIVVLFGARQHPRPSVPRKANRPEGWTMPTWDPRPTGYFEPEAAAVEAFKARWTRLWIERLAAEGLTPNKDHGIRFDVVESAADAEKLGEYLAKTQDGKNVGHELARSDMKAGRRGGMTPFEMVRRGRLLEAGIDPDDLPGEGDLDQLTERVREYEQATKGRRAMEASRYLRAAYGMDQDGDEGKNEHDIVHAEDGQELEHGAAFSAPAWTAICRAGLDRQVEEALEDGGFPALMQLLTTVHIAHGVRELDAAGIKAAAEKRTATMKARRERQAQRRAVRKATGDLS
jgi:hypothetical protein